jgi:hypothetical protein
MLRETKRGCDYPSLCESQGKCMQGGKLKGPCGDEAGMWSLKLAEGATMQIANIGAAKITDPRPVSIRWAVQPDGSKVLQFAQRWQRGWNESGFEWVDVPTVEAAADGVSRTEHQTGGK